jgi:hypothetical protein
MKKQLKKDLRRQEMRQDLSLSETKAIENKTFLTSFNPIKRQGTWSQRVKDQYRLQFEDNPSKQSREMKVMIRTLLPTGDQSDSHTINHHPRNQQ